MPSVKRWRGVRVCVCVCVGGGGGSLVQWNVLGYTCVERCVLEGGGFIGTAECAWVHMCRKVGGGGDSLVQHGEMYLGTHV